MTRLDAANLDAYLFAGRQRPGFGARITQSECEQWLNAADALDRRGTEWKAETLRNAVAKREGGVFSRARARARARARSFPFREGVGAR